MRNESILETLFDTGFTGRLIQVAEALDPGDAVSNQILNLDRQFKRLGLESMVLSKWHHQDVAASRRDLTDVQVTEKDIVIFHFCGFSEHSVPWVLEQYCTRIIYYHNITPHRFFPVGSALYEFCRKGREQLKEIVPRFHAHWGASTYNLEELHAAGADPAKSVVIPIIVPSAPRPTADTNRSRGQWLFVGRIVANKCQLDLIDVFAQARKANPAIAEKLVLVGGYNPQDPYYRKIVDRITKLKLQDQVELTSKISDAEREAYFRSSQFYVSISEHEGFGVPLVEAPLRGLPVLALDRAAAKETTAGHGLIDDRAELVAMIQKLSEDRGAYDRLVNWQRENAYRFSERNVCHLIRGALSALLPARNRYKTLSIVICTYNRIDHLKRCLDYLRCQSNPNFEVVVVDGPSTDGTKAYLARHGNGIKVFENPHCNLSASRNIGIANAAGDIVAFIDDDSIPFDTWVDSVLRAYNERPLTVAALGGPVFFAGTLSFQSEDIGIDVRARTKISIRQQELGKDGWYRAIAGTNSSFVRETTIRHGGFDEQFDYFLDEAELSLRLQLKGHLVGYSQDVLVRHEFAQSHKRRGKHDYDRKTVCKNISYFVAAYGGLEGRMLRTYLEQRLSTERVAPLVAAHDNGELTEDACEAGVRAIWEGMEQGLADARDWPKTRTFKDTPPAFLPFAVNLDYHAVGRDMAPLHICIISKEVPPFTHASGIGTLYYHLANELLLMGHHISLIVPSHEDRDWRQGPLTVCYTDTRGEVIPHLDRGFGNNMNWSLSAFARLAGLHEKHRVDIVESALKDTQALAFANLERWRRPPLVLRLVTPFQMAADMNLWHVAGGAASAFNAAERTLIANADAVLPISGQIATTIERCHKLERDERWELAPGGIAHWPLFNVQENYDNLDRLGDLDCAGLADEKIVLFIGRLELRKGVDILFGALEAILAGDPAARIVIAGKDSDGWQQKVLASLPRGQESRVHFLGEVSGAIRDKLLAHAHCLVVPSRYESFGLAPLEAFVHKVPVVASRSGAIPEVVLDRECGLLFSEGNSKELADAVVRILTNPTLHSRLSLGAAKRIRDFSARNSAIRTVEIYGHLLAQRSIGKPRRVPVAPTLKLADYRASSQEKMTG